VPLERASEALEHRPEDIKVVVDFAAQTDARALGETAVEHRA